MPLIPEAANTKGALAGQRCGVGQWSKAAAGAGRWASGMLAFWFLVRVCALGAASRK